MTLGYAHTFSPRLINSFRFGIYRMSADVGNTFPGDNPLSGDKSFGYIPGQPHGQIRVPGLSNLGNALGGPDRYLFHWTSFQGYDDISWTRGSHSFKFGVSFERMRDNIVATANVTGTFDFNSLTDFLTNRPFSFTAALPGSDIGRGFRQTVLASYIQDDWLLRRNLSVSLGLRYEMATVPSEANGELTTLRNTHRPAAADGRGVVLQSHAEEFCATCGLGLGSVTLRISGGQLGIRHF